MPECYIRGNTIKYLRVPDEVWFSDAVVFLLCPNVILMIYKSYFSGDSRMKIEGSLKDKRITWQRQRPV
jgi:hypothetical protein